MQTIKKLLFILMLMALSMVSDLSAVWLNNVPTQVTQPDGTVLDLFITGDEFHRWMHNDEGYTIVEDEETGFYTWAVNSKSALAPTSHRAGDERLVSTGQAVHLTTPQSHGIRPNENISDERYLERRERRNLEGEDRSILRAPSTGTVNNILIYVGFSDQNSYPQNVSYYNNEFNSTTAGFVSVYNYFKEQSYNQLTVNTHFYPTQSGTAVVPYIDPNPRSYYTMAGAGNNEATHVNRFHTMLINAVNSISGSVPSGLVVDSDNDGDVDNVIFLISGGPVTTHPDDMLWPHNWVLYPNYPYTGGTYPRINNKRVYGYNLNLASNSNPGGSSFALGVAVYAHEFAHAIGAPDLYRYSYAGIDPIGAWCLMASTVSNPQSITAYVKQKYLNWITIPTLSTAGIYSLPPLNTGTGTVAYRINSPNATNQYFVVEFRKVSTSPAIADRTLGGSGLVVYRVATGTTSGNRNGPPDELYIYRPNGTLTNNGTIASAFFASNTTRTSINDATNPNSFIYSSYTFGTNTTNGVVGGTTAGGLDISNIGSATGTTISFQYGSVVTNDLSALSITGANTINTGTASTYTISVKNEGSATVSASAYSVRLMRQGSSTALATANGVNLTSGSTNNFNLSWTPTTTGSFQLYGEVVYSADQVSTNNQTSNLSVTVNPANDLSALSISGANTINVGNTSTYIISVKNEGSATVSASAYTVRLMRQGSSTALATSNGVNLTSGNTSNFNLSWTPTTAGSFQLYGEVVYSADQNLTNNQTSNLSVTVYPEGMLVLLSENFNALATGTGSGAQTTLSSVGWTATLNNYSGIEAGVGVSNTNALRMNLYSSSTTQSATSPVITGITEGADLSFAYRMIDYGNNPDATTLGTNDKIFIEVSTTGATGTFTAIREINSSNHTVSMDFATISQSLSAYSGQNINIRFRATWGTGDWYFILDDVMVQAPPSFDPPQSFTATAGNSQVVLSWTAPQTRGSDENIRYQAPFPPHKGGQTTRPYELRRVDMPDSPTRALSTYKIYRGTTSGFTPSTSNLVYTSPNATTLTWTNTGLTNGTSYYYKIVATYASPDGESEPLNATPYPVIPNSIITLYEEGFESTSGFALPVGWTKVGGVGEIGWRTINSTAELPGIENGSASANNGVRNLARSWQHSSSESWAFSNGIPLVANTNYTIRFYYRAPGYSQLGEFDNFEVRIGTTATATALSSAHQLFNLQNTMVPDYTLAVCPFTPTSSGTYYLGFHDTTPEQEGIFILIDDISIVYEASAPVPVFNAPQSFTASAGSQQVTLTWTAPQAGSTGTLSSYKIYRATSETFALSNDNLVHTTANATTLTWTNTGLTNGTSYYYKIVAAYTSPAGDSDPLEATPYPAVPFSITHPPQNLTATAGNAEVTLNWQAPLTGSTGTLTGYKVYNDTINVGGTLSNTALSYTVTGLTNGIEYSFKVVAIYTDGVSEPSDIVSTTPFALVPVVNLSATQGFTSISLSWEEPESTVYLTGYKVLKYDAVADTFVVISGDGVLPLSQTSYQDNGLAHNTLYRYRVNAVFDMSPLPIEEVSASLDISTLYPKPPVGLDGEQVVNTVVLTWEEPETPYDGTISGYKVYRRMGTEGAFSALTPTPVSETTYTDENAIDGSTYQYFVTTVYHTPTGESDQPAEFFTIIFIIVGDEKIPDVYKTELVGNYPNPFNPSTTIQFGIRNAGFGTTNVSIDVYNIKGQRVRSLVDGQFTTGQHSVTWNGTDDNGHSVGSGIYFYRMKTGDFVQTNKMILMK